MIGKYVTGVGNAHKNNTKRKEFFNCPMYGTFNIKVNKAEDLYDYAPAVSKANTEYYLVKITKNDRWCYGYLNVWKKGKQSKNILEIVSKQLIPDYFKKGELRVDLLYKWSKDKRTEWAKDMYSWQTFDWTPKRRANSNDLAKKIDAEIDWSEKTVLDIGSNYGYHAFNASKKGAIVHGVEINNSALRKSKIINDHIEMQDVTFSKHDDNSKSYDVILFLSVHHQYDPHYHNLKETLDGYKGRCDTLVTELIMPPMFGKGMTVEEIDEIVGGKVLWTYPHPVRGERRLYIWKK